MQSYSALNAKMKTAISEVVFSPETLEWNYLRLLGSIRGGLAPPNKLLEADRRKFDRDILRNVYGDFNASNHMFNAAPLDWGFRLTEPQITKALAHFLSKPDMKAARLRAFMETFGVEIPKDIALLEAASIEAESESTENDRQGRVKRRGRIDIEILYDLDPNKAKEKPFQKGLIIEAKLGHQVTREQLKNYRITSNKRADFPEHFILAQHDGDEKRLHHKQRNKWSVVYWDRVLIAFEKQLVDIGDFDEDFRRFRRTLWKRVNGSNRKRTITS